MEFIQLLSDEYKVKLGQLRPIISDIVKLGIKVEQQFPDSHQSELIFIRMNLFSRFIHRLKCINYLLVFIESDPTMEDNIGLIIRAGLADLIPMLYLDVVHSNIKNINDDNDENNILHAEQTRAFLCDHIYSLMSFFKDYKSAGEYSDDQYRMMLDKLKSDHSPYFYETPMDYKNPKANVDAKRFVKNAEMIAYMRQYPQVLDNKIIHQIYEMYSYYSKYEHFGIFTNGMQNMEMDTLIFRILSCIRFFIYGIYLCCIHLMQNFSYLTNEPTTFLALRDKYDKNLYMELKPTSKSPASI